MLRTEPAELDDLHARLRLTRWPDTPVAAEWSLGAEVDYLRELVTYWAHGFDWLAQEAMLARHPHFRVALDGLGIRFVHVRAAAPTGWAMPLVLCHGNRRRVGSRFDRSISLLRVLCCPRAANQWVR